MFHLTSLSLLALAVSSVSGLVVPRSPAAPSTWSDSLEDYSVYHTRYLAIGCQNKHSDIAFFDRCCHPLQNGAQPDPTCGASEPSSDGDEFDDDCDGTDEAEDDDSTSTPSYSTPSPSSAPEPEEKIANTDNVVSAKISASDSGYISGGVATFYYQGGNAGACGQYHGDYDLIAAIDADRYGNTSRKSSLCGKRVQIINTKNGKSVTVTIADACPTCLNSNSIDLSVGAFKKIATEEEGQVPIKWKFV